MGNGGLAISGFVVVFLVAIVAFVQWKFSPVKIVRQMSSGQSFDSAKWKAHPEHDQEDTVRCRLAEDLVLELDEGSLRSEVIEMIGTPDDTVISESEECEWLYREDQYFLSNQTTLHISYDRSDKLTNAAIEKGQNSSALPFTNQLTI